VHEIVDVAIRDNWAPIQAYQMELTEILGGVVAEGQAAGEFGPGDPAELAMLTLCACVGIHHPLMIAAIDCTGAAMAPEQIVGFALRALAKS